MSMWQLLQVSDVLDREFGSALSESVPTLAWEPIMSYAPWRLSETDADVADPPLRVRRFPLQRGYARPWIANTLRLGPAQLRRMLRYTPDANPDPLVCTTPYYAPVAELWPGPVIYYLTDLIAAYSGADTALVHALDTRLCRAATLVCPNSERLASYLMETAGCDPLKIQVLPNATRASNILPRPELQPAALPRDLDHLHRPIAGVMGNLASNMDWILLQQAVQSTPEFTWVFVGPTSMPIDDAAQHLAREAVLRRTSAHFTGAKPYGSLAAYARSFDVAVLPYMRREPTYSGSSTRFYEHLAACRPMLATRGFEELLHKQPLLHLVDTAEEVSDALRDLKQVDFNDGHAHVRWQASRAGTWQARALAMQAALANRLNGLPARATIDARSASLEPEPDLVGLHRAD